MTAIRNNSAIGIGLGTAAGPAAISSLQDASLIVPLGTMYPSASFIIYIDKFRFLMYTCWISPAVHNTLPTAQ